MGSHIQIKCDFFYDDDSDRFLFMLISARINETNNETEERNLNPRNCVNAISQDVGPIPYEGEHARNESDEIW